MKNLRTWFLITLMTITIYSCKTLLSYTNIFTCDFRMESLKNPRLAAVDVQTIKNVSDLSLLQVGKLTTAYASGNLPLSFVLNLESKNPNATPATMAKFDWILKIDDVQMATGTNNTQYTIPANNGTAMIPLTISINLLEVLKGESKNALLNFGLNLADAGGKPTRVSLQVKPTINLGTVPISYPGYITLGTEFGATK